MVKVGDQITCRDLEDLMKKMNALLNEGIESEFHFPMGNHDFVLEVTGIHGQTAAGSQSQT